MPGPVAPVVTGFRVFVGTPRIDQGSAPPLIRGVPGPVPFTISTDWLVFAAGAWNLGLAITDANGRPVLVAADGRWRERFSGARELGPGSMHEEFTVLALLEGGGVLRFQRLVNGAVVSETELELDVEAAEPT